MKVTRGMIHDDLKKSSFALRIVPLFFRHKWTINIFNYLIGRNKGKDIKGLQCDEVYIPSEDGDYKIRTRIYKPLNHTGKLPIMVYLHGGGYVTGNPEQFHNVIEQFINKRPCIVVSPDYRKALKKPFPAGFNDCYDTLLWAKENAYKLGATTEQLMVAGHSAGGGLTAAVTLKARDTKDVDIVFQMPIYPMIDDLQPLDSERYIESPSWDSRSNKMGWGTYLSDLRESGQTIPAYAAPARNKDYREFPPTMTFVGDLDPLYKETVDYVAALKNAGVDVAFKEYKGCFHAFDVICDTGNISQDALGFTGDTYAEFYDKYL